MTSKRPFSRQLRNSGRSPSRKPATTRAASFSLNQPEPFLPEITKVMVRKFLRHRYQGKISGHNPPTTSEWLMAEWYLAQELKVSPLRTAFFASEAASFPVPVGTAAVSKPPSPQTQRRP